MRRGHHPFTNVIKRYVKNNNSSFAFSVFTCGYSQTVNNSIEQHKYTIMKNFNITRKAAAWSLKKNSDVKRGGFEGFELLKTTSYRNPYAEGIL